MITIYAEKLDVALKIVVALSDYYHNNKLVTLDNVEEMKTAIFRKVSNKGYIDMEWKGNKYAVTWGSGHMAGLKHAKDYNEEYKAWYKMPMPFIPEKYEIKVREGFDYKKQKPTGRPDEGAIKQLKIIKNLFEKSDYIINATDFDREGELIFAYVYEIVGCDKPYKRAVIDSFTKEGLLNTFNNLKDQSFSYNTELAGRGRAIADWVVGINLTTLMSLKYGDAENPLIAIGRVQTPTLNMIVEREKEIQNFVSEPFWRLKAKFLDEDIEFEADHETNRFDKKEDAEKILSKIDGKDGEVISFEEKNSKRKVPMLYNLTALSLDANKIYGINASKTLEIAQELYSAGYITYPRSSSRHLTDDMKDTVNDVLNELSNIEEYKHWINKVPEDSRKYTKRHFDSKKVDSHYAIIPTNQVPSKLNKQQEEIYDLIAKSLIRIIFNDAELKNSEVVIDVEGEKFKAKGSVIVDPQWMQVDAMPKNMNILPDISKGDIFSGEYILHEGKTTPPPRYNDGSLLSAMVTAGKNIEDDELREFLENSEYKGIGRDSTRSSIIENVVKLYCTRKGSQIIPTKRAMQLIDTLPIEEIKSAEMTAKWELALDDVEKGSLELKSFVKDIEDKTKEWCEEIKKLPSPKRKRNIETFDKPCPICKGDILVFDWGWICEKNKKDDKQCHLFIPKSIGGKNITKTMLNTLLSLKTTPYYKDLKTKDGKKTYGARFAINKETGKLDFIFDSGVNCPKCNGNMSTNSMFYYCRNSDCRFSFPFIVAQYELTQTDINDLLNKGETKKINKFVSKKGKNFTASLCMQEDGSLTFSFD